MNRLKIDGVDVFLDNKELGQGKITISDNYTNNFSYYWGSMGGTLEDFLCRINAQYFVGCLGNANRENPINNKKTVKNIRKLLRDEFYRDYPWYSYKDLHKTIAEALKDFEKESFNSVEGWMMRLDSLVSDFCVYTCDDLTYQESRKVEEELKSLLNCEPWHLIHYDDHPKNIWLSNFHKKLVKELKKQKKLQLVK